MTNDKTDSFMMYGEKFSVNSNNSPQMKFVFERDRMSRLSNAKVLFKSSLLPNKISISSILSTERM